VSEKSISFESVPILNSRWKYRQNRCSRRANT